MSDSTLYRAYPELVPNPVDLKNAAETLQDAYDDYTKHVSPSQMTIALETAAYILWAASQHPPTSAADFGSGFTSYVLRLVCDDVWSVDDSQEWLDWTRGFLDRHKLTAGHLELWDDYRTRDLTHDLIVYDFSSGEVRDANFMFALGQLNPAGIAILDDANHQGHQASMHYAAMTLRYDLFGLQDWTRDQYRRFAALVVA